MSVCEGAQCTCVDELGEDEGDDKHHEGDVGGGRDAEPEFPPATRMRRSTGDGGGARASGILRIDERERVGLAQALDFDLVVAVSKSDGMIQSFPQWS